MIVEDKDTTSTNVKKIKNQTKSSGPIEESRDNGVSSM